MDTVQMSNDVIYAGWASLGLSPESTSKAMTTNDCIIVDDFNSCNYFKYKEEPLCTL